MRIPKRDAGEWAQEVIGRCIASRTKRLMRGAAYRNVYLTGDRDGTPQTFNKTRLFINRLSSWTYSPASLRFTMDSDGDVDSTQRAMGKRAIAELQKRFRRGGVDRCAREANKWARVKGKTFIKLLWTANGFEPCMLQPECMGVEREDLTSLDQQKAFVHTSWYTIDGFVNLVANHEPAERDKLIRKAAGLAKASNISDKPDNQMLKQVLLGGMYPYKDGTQSNANAGQQAQVDWLGGQTPYLSPELAARMLQIDELWVWDDETEDWTTIQMLFGAGNDAFIIGKDTHRNIFADAYDPKDTSRKSKRNPDNPLSGMHPFVEFSPNPLDGYFWGLSDIQSVALLQRGINRRIDGINRILRRQEDPARAYTGFTGINQNKHAQLNKPGGWISESTPNAAMKDVQPELPKGLWESLDKLLQYFDDVGGVTPTMGGTGDAGIRSDVHATTLLRTATSDIKDQAIEIERSISELGNLGLAIMKTQVPQKMRAWVKAGEAGVEAAAAEPTNVEMPPVKDQKPVDFLLADLDDCLYATVDSHSSSPIFAVEEREFMFELRKAGAVSPAGLVRALQPPHADQLLDDLERHDVAQQELIAEHPELAFKHKK